ncbi:MAG: hypothetical protein ACKVQT_15760 [Burkholderiales bacterium]
MAEKPISGFEVTFAPPNSIVFVADPTHDYEIADNTGAALVTSTSSSIAIGTLAQMDGTTTVRLDRAFAAPGGTLAFDGTLDTPGKRVAIIASGADEMLSMEVSHGCSQVRIWVNDLSEPSLILIEVR